MRLLPRPRTVLAWALWAATMGACAAGLVVALLVARPLTAQVPLDGGLFAVGGPLGTPPSAWPPGQLAKGMVVAGLALHVASLLAALLCVILRFRASRGVERQQLRWVATGAAIAVLGVTVPLGELRGAWVDPVVILCVPLAVAVAVLRYRLWDLDRLVSRTVTYALVTALLVVPYVLIVPTAGRLASGSGSPAVVDQTMQPTRTSLWLRPYRR